MTVPFPLLSLQVPARADAGSSLEKGDGTIPLVGELQEQAERARRWLEPRLLARGDATSPSALSSLVIHTVVVSGVLPSADPGRVHYLVSIGEALPSLLATLVVASRISPEAFDAPLAAVFPWQVTPGVEVIASPSGQGLSYGMGKALAARLDGRKQRVIVLLREAEVEEGQVWEAAMAAAHFGVGNLTALVLRRAQGERAEDLLARRWRAFGWDVYTVKGDDSAQLLAVFHSTAEPQRPCPIAILASAEVASAGHKKG